jgi:hypothetical protein
MILDALKYMVALGKRNIEVQKVPLPGDQVLVIAGDTVEKLASNRHLRSDAPTSLADLLDWTSFVIVDPSSDETDIECFVEEKSITIVIDREKTVCDSAKLVLRPSSEMLALQKLLSGPVSQKELIAMFRGPLAKAIKPHYLPAFRGIQFRSVTNSDRNQSSLGRSVELEVSSTSGTIPDEIVLEMPVYDPAIAELGLASINLAVEVNFDTERFEFLPVADTISIAVTMARREIRAILVEGLPKNAMVVLGSHSTVKAAE